MKPVRIPFGLVVLATLAFTGICAVGPAHARDGVSDPDSYRALDVGTGQVTLDVQDAPFGQVISEIIEPQTRVNILVAAEAADQRVTLRIVDVHWVQALRALADQIGGVLVRDAQNLLRVERPKPVDFDFEEEDVRAVIKAIATFADANVIVHSDVKGTITLSLSGTPWRESLEQVVKVAGFALVEADFGILNIIPRELLETTHTYYRFKFLRPPAPYKGVVSSQSGRQGGGGGGSGGSGGGGSNNNGEDIVVGNPYVPTDDPAELERQFPIIEALRQIVGADANGNVRYIPASNAIIATGTSPSIKAVLAMVEQLDVEPPQVFIDMNFVVTSNQDAVNIGLDAGDSTGIALGASGADVLHMLPFNLGGTPFDIASSLSGTSFPPPSASSYQYGTLSTSQTQLLWNFLQRDTSSRLVQAPKLLALDNQEATIFVGESIRYARSQSATNQNGGLTFAIEEDPNSPVNIGFQLLVIPHVIPGEQKIRMTVIPQRRALTGNGPVPGFDRITVAGQSIDLPRVQSTSLVTHMILRDGQTAVIGGLLEDREVERVDKVPLLGDVPGLGSLFQGKESTKVKEHLLITITPRIVKGTDVASCTIGNELAGRDERISAEYTDLYGDCAVPAGAVPAGFPAADPLPAPAPAGQCMPQPEVVTPDTGVPVPIAPGR